MQMTQYYRFGLCGAHRTGKSSLVYHISQTAHSMHKAYRITTMYASISAWQRELGYDSSNQNYEWETRKKIQEYLLSCMDSWLSGNTYNPLRWQVDNIRLTDRTPLDLIGYALWSYPKNPTAQDKKWMDEYIIACVNMTNTHYNGVMLIQPGIPLVADSKSAPTDPEMIDTFNSYYLAQFINSRLTIPKFVLPADCLDIEERATTFMEFVYAQLKPPVGI